MPGMGNVKNWIVPLDSMTITDQKNYREQAYQALVQEAVKKGLGKSEAEIDVRDLQLNVIDFVVAPTVDDWETAALAAPVGTLYTIFGGLVAPQVPVNRVHCYYGVNIGITVPNPVSRLVFRKQGAAGNIIAIFDIEKLEGMQNLGAFFSQPVVYDPQDLFAIQVRNKIATGVLARIPLWAMVAEPRGTTIA